MKNLLNKGIPTIANLIISIYSLFLIGIAAVSWFYSYDCIHTCSVLLLAGIAGLIIAKLCSLGNSSALSLLAGSVFLLWIAFVFSSFGNDYIDNEYIYAAKSSYFASMIYNSAIGTLLFMIIVTLFSSNSSCYTEDNGCESKCCSSHKAPAKEQMICSCGACKCCKSPGISKDECGCCSSRCCAGTCEGKCLCNECDCCKGLTPKEICHCCTKKCCKGHDHNNASSPKCNNHNSGQCNNNYNDTVCEQTENCSDIKTGTDIYGDDGINDNQFM